MVIDDEGAELEGLDIPPWRPAAEETAASDHSTFHKCEEVVKAFASRANGTISDEIYTLSDEWGKILRAKLASRVEESSGTFLVTCWQAVGRGVQIWVKADDGKP